MNLLKKYRHIWIILIYGVFYMIAFLCLENSNMEPHIIHSVIDDKIPFCEYFIIPYVIWYGFIAATLWFFAFRCKEKREYYQLITTFITGNTIFLLLSFVYPNGQALRPVLEGDSIFIQAVRFLYWIDTPTNILPSMHVFNVLACCGALFKNADCRKHKGFLAGTGLLTGLIILSTMFLKQHSIIDVVLAVILYAGCFVVIYQIVPRYEEQLSILLTKKEMLTIPNLLSCFRLVLAVLFLGIAMRGGVRANQMILTVILIVSGITDLLDGKIARRFHMVSEVGKLIDPVADKVTQGVLLLCLLSEYDLMKWVFLLFVIKESYMVVAGTKTIVKNHENEGAKWYGKVSTVVFYVVMAILLVFQDIPEKTADFLIGVSGVCMLLALLLYAWQYHVMEEKRLRRIAEDRKMKEGA